MRRILSPSLNPAGLSSAALAIYAAVTMILHVVHHQGVFNAPVAVAAIGAVAALLTRQAVTPVRDPHDGNGAPLHTTAVLGSMVAAAAAAPKARPYAQPSNVTVTGSLPPAAPEATPDTGGM